MLSSGGWTEKDCKGSVAMTHSRTDHTCQQTPWSQTSSLVTNSQNNSAGVFVLLLTKAENPTSCFFFYSLQECLTPFL